MYCTHCEPCVHQFAASRLFSCVIGTSILGLFSLDHLWQVSMRLSLSMSRTFADMRPRSWPLLLTCTSWHAER
jgi:hypothetical protein